MSSTGCEEEDNAPLGGRLRKGRSPRGAGRTSREVSPQDPEESDQGAGTGLRGKVASDRPTGRGGGSQCHGTVSQSPSVDLIAAPRCKGADVGRADRPRRIHPVLPLGEKAKVLNLGRK